VSVAEPLIQSTLLGEAIDGGPAAVFVADEHGRYVAVNRYACELLGYTREEMLALSVADVGVSADAAQEFAEVVAHRLHAGTSELMRKDGSSVEIEYRAGETKAAGMSFYVVVGWPTGS
jgi:PAS domain S-box-containing protein